MVEVSADDDEATAIFDHGGDAMRIVELCLEWVDAVFTAAIAYIPCESAHRPVAENGTDTVVGVVAQLQAVFVVNAHTKGVRESGSERVVAVLVRAHIGTDRSTPSDCGDAAVVVDDPQAVLT